MTAEIDIANLALARVRAGRTIASFTENSVEANQCARFYEHARDSALTAFAWGFARRYAQPALVDAPLTGWPFAYRQPANALQVIAVRSQDDVQTFGPRCWHMPALPAHDFELASDDDGQLILTRTAQAVLAFTARVENPDAWSRPFQQAVAFLLASYIAVPISGDKTLAKENVEFYKDALEGAKTHDANQQHLRGHVPSGAEARL